MLPPAQNMASTAIEPSLDFLIPTSQAPVTVSVDSVLSRTELDLLYHQYFKAVDPLAHVIHKPTFDRQFIQILLDVYPSKVSTKSFTALVLAMCLAAAVSLLYSQPQVNFQTNKGALVEKLKFATERALVAAQHMKSLKLETMQAFAIYLVCTPLQLPIDRTSSQTSRFPNVVVSCPGLSPPWSVRWSVLHNVLVYTVTPLLPTLALWNVTFEACSGIRSVSSTFTRASNKGPSP